MPLAPHASPSPDDPFRERTRRELLVAAETLIAAEGHRAVHARRVAQMVGCAVGTVYNVYRDIDGLILAANLRTLAALGDVLRAARDAAREQGLEARLMALAVAYVGFASAHQQRWRAVFEHRLPDDYPVPPSFYDDRRGLLGLIEDEIADAMPDADGEAGQDTARQDAARALFSATHGNVLLALDAKLGPVEPGRCERQIRFIVHHVVAGLTRDHR
jgi:AcrR family transcriptional regulator